MTILENETSEILMEISEMKTLFGVTVMFPNVISFPVFKAQKDGCLVLEAELFRFSRMGLMLQETVKLC